MQGHGTLAVAAASCDRVAAACSRDALAEGDVEQFAERVPLVVVTPWAGIGPRSDGSANAVVTCPVAVATLGNDTAAETLSHIAASETPEASRIVVAQLARSLQRGSPTAAGMSDDEAVALTRTLLRGVTNRAGRTPRDEARHQWEGNVEYGKAIASEFTSSAKDDGGVAGAALVLETAETLTLAAAAVVSRTALVRSTPTSAADAKILARLLSPTARPDASWLQPIAEFASHQRTRSLPPRATPQQRLDCAAAATLRRALFSAALVAAGFDPLQWDGEEPLSGTGPRWGASFRFPTYLPITSTDSSGDDAPEGSVNLRFFAALAGQVEALARSGSWAFWAPVANLRDNVLIRIAGGAPSSSTAATPSPPTRLVVYGDWGEECSGLRKLAAAVDDEVAARGAQAVVLLGDNFYPSGVESPFSFRLTREWRDRTLRRDKRWKGTPRPLEGLPWLVALGNHDYKLDCGEAQLLLTDVGAANPDAAWVARGDDVLDPPPYHGWPNDGVQGGCNYATVYSGADYDVHLFIFDTNPVQFSVRHDLPTAIERWHTKDLPWLRRQLAASVAAERATDRKAWRVVCAHHPMFTNGRGHANEGRCLQGETYLAVGKEERGPLPGLNLQPTLDEFNVHMMLTGHEHVMQIKRTAYRHGDCVHAVIGAAVETHFYKHELPEELRQVDRCLYRETGFATLSATAAELRLDFISTKTPGALLHSEVVVNNTTTSSPSQ